MSLNTYQVHRIKELILAFISARGPSLPIHLARDVKAEPLFVSAFLSELYNEGKIKMSSMKIGSSSLYFLAGQEAQLENFIENLNQREKEAFLLLKEKKILEDEKLTPVMRVAIRSLKDFAVPVAIGSQEQKEQRLIWRYFLLPENEVSALHPAPKMPEPPAPEILQKPGGQIREKKPKKPKIQESSEFSLKLRDFLAGKDIEVLSVIEEKKKEFSAKVRIDTLFGKQEYLLAAKDKKKLTETDIAFALQKAQAEKMPALIMSLGDLDKKALLYLQNWKNLVKFEKFKF